VFVPPQKNKKKTQSEKEKELGKWKNTTRVYFLI
jgi:hypothetical protein